MRSLAVVRGGGSLEDMLYVGHNTVWACHQQRDWLTIGSGIRDPGSVPARNLESAEFRGGIYCERGDTQHVLISPIASFNSKNFFFNKKIFLTVYFFSVWVYRT